MCCLSCRSKELLDPKKIHQEVFDSISYIQTTTNAMGAVYKAQHDAKAWNYVNFDSELTELERRVKSLQKNLATAEANLREHQPLNKYVRTGIQVVKIGCAVGGIATFVSPLITSDDDSSKEQSKVVFYVSTALFVAGFVISQATSWCWERLAKRQEEQMLWKEISNQKKLISIVTSVVHILRHKKEAEKRMLAGHSLSREEIAIFVEVLNSIPEEFRARCLNPDALLSRLMSFNDRGRRSSAPIGGFEASTIHVLGSRSDEEGSAAGTPGRSPLQRAVLGGGGVGARPHIVIDIDAEATS